MIWMYVVGSSKEQNSWLQAKHLLISVDMNFKQNQAARGLLYISVTLTRRVKLLEENSKCEVSFEKIRKR
ncbi:hypothetical protein L484_022133 [Morus notabilis]|uniref:Uncharacterized protein n=1 Tax=Morus notabilis TaxID=981085 RepID=W9QZ12_9ROSA|nr:hypothetical protein L484_022133 [Morus notabilis]